MIILPAIDLKGGECVRLVQGDYQTAHKVAEDALQTAERFRAAGAEWLHAVDLDGAKSAEPLNEALIVRIARESGLQVETGGGIRNLQTVARYLENGISRVILGSAALNQPELVRRAVKEYGERIAVGIDARGGMVAAQGWTQTSRVDYLEFAKRMEETGVKYIIFTDISRDGTLTGPNLEMLRRLCETVSCHIIASGGVSGLQDVENLRSLRLYGAICGKAVYTGDLDLSTAIQRCGGQENE